MARTRLSLIQRRNQTSAVEVWEEEDGRIVTYQDGKPLVAAEVNSLTGGIEFSDEYGFEIVAGLRESKTGAENIEALQAAHDALASTGGTIKLPKGNFNLAGTVTISNGFAGPLGNQNIIFRGHGIGGTILTQQTAGVATFLKTSGHAHGFEEFSLIGPGTGNSSSVGIEWINAAGGGYWKNLWIQGFGSGSRFIDATSMTFDNCMWHANGTNIELGFNCDLFQFVGGRCQNAVVEGVRIGYRDAGHAAGALQCNPVTFIGVRFGAMPLAVNIADYGASNIEFNGCYFENNAQIASIGDAAQASGPKDVQFRNCFFTVVGAGGSATQVLANLHANQETTITFEHCRSDTGSFTGRWVDLGINCRMAMQNSLLLSTGAHVQWNGATYTVDQKRDMLIDRGHYEVFDGSVMGSIIPYDVSVTNGTGKTFAKFRRTNGSTGADLGSLTAQILDVNGQFAAFSGAFLFAQPGSALPAAGATYRGVTVIQQGAGGVADTVVCCMKSSADTYSWKVVATG